MVFDNINIFYFIIAYCYRSKTKIYIIGNPIFSSCSKLFFNNNII